MSEPMSFEEVANIFIEGLAEAERRNHETIATLARLLDGAMADDHASIREAAAWLAEHRPESDYPE